jgi:hypothetical protein
MHQQPQQSEQPFNIVLTVEGMQFYLGDFVDIDTALATIEKILETTKGNNEWNTQH